MYFCLAGCFREVCLVHGKDNQTGKTNGEHISKDQTITWLLCHAGGTGSDLPCKQDDISCPQRRRILQQNKFAESSGRTFFLSDDVDNPPNNGAILTLATIIKAVMSSAAEAELGALYLNAKEGVYLRQILTELGHPQPRTPIQTDNSTAEGVINNKIQPKWTKAMDMRFHWLRNREAQGQFRIYWRPGKTNLADYFTKHHPPMHHVNVRSEFLSKVKDLAEARRQREELGQTKSQFCNSWIATRVC